MEHISASAVRRRIAEGRLTSVEATKAVFDRIDAYEEAVGAYITTFGREAMDAAAQIDRRIAQGEKVGPLAGVPVAVKEDRKSVV